MMATTHLRYDGGTGSEDSRLASPRMEVRKMTTPSAQSISATRRVLVHYFSGKRNLTPRFSYVRLTPEPTARVCHILSYGQCHALALALHELTGWPILGEYDDFGESRHTYHFVVQCPLPGFCTADATGIHCKDAGYRKVNPDTIRLGRLRNFLPPALEFARHFAPPILREINVQLESSRAGRGRSYWPFCWDGT